MPKLGSYGSGGGLVLLFGMVRAYSGPGSWGLAENGLTPMPLFLRLWHPLWTLQYEPLNEAEKAALRMGDDGGSGILRLCQLSALGRLRVLVDPSCWHRSLFPNSR